MALFLGRKKVEHFDVDATTHSTVSEGLSSTSKLQHVIDT